MTFIFPIPPSVNHAWGRTRSGMMFVTKEGLAFRKAVALIVGGVSFSPKSRLTVTIALHFDKKYRCDIDNRIKSLLDACQHAGLFEDDNQVDALHVFRMESVKGGKCVVDIETL